MINSETDSLTKIVGYQINEDIKLERKPKCVTACINDGSSNTINSPNNNYTKTNKIDKIQKSINT